jgi:hypothetical protein
MSLLLCGALVGSCLLRDAAVVSGVLLVDLSCEGGLSVQRTHLMINVLAVVVRHLHAPVEII